MPTVYVGYVVLYAADVRLLPHKMKMPTKENPVPSAMDLSDSEKRMVYKELPRED
jgi:hypothetical protein